MRFGASFLALLLGVVLAASLASGAASTVVLAVEGMT
jgi:hypothetical protein